MMFQAIAFTPSKRASRGIALMLVMGAVAVVFVIGLNVLSGLPATAQAAQNLIHRDAAVYLAESGLVEALARLENPPGGADWYGVTGRQVEGMSGTYDVAITDRGDGTFEIEATGHAPGAGGGVISHTLAMIVEVAGGGASGNAYTMTHATLFGAGGFVPGNARIRGDVFVPGSVLNLGRVDGTLSATGSIVDLGNTQAIEANAQAKDVPEVDVDAYLSYRHGGSSQAAEVITANPDDVLAGQYTPDHTGNALGVVVVEGDLTLSDNIDFARGVLIVRGNLDLNGHRLRVEGPTDSMQIALIVEGDVTFSQQNSEIEVRDGVTYVSGRLTTGWRARNSRLDARAGLIARQGLPLAFNGDIDVRWDNNNGNGAAINFFGSDGQGGGADGPGRRTVTLLSYSANPGS